MKLLARLLLPLAICSFALHARADDPAPRLAITARSGNSLAGTIDHVPFIVLRGTADQRGQAMGLLWGDYFLRSLADIVPFVQIQDPHGWDKLTRLADASFTAPDDITLQMRAFITGLRQAVPLDKRSALLGRDIDVQDLKATYAYADIVSAGRIPPASPSASAPANCSSFSAWGALTADGNTIVGRNLDYPALTGLLPFAIVAQQPSEKDRLATIEISPLWFGALTTINEKGVVLLGHDEASLPVNYQSGFTLRFLALRPAIETVTPASATQILAAALRDTRPFTGTSFHVSFPIQPNGPLPTVLEWDGNPKDHGVTLRTPDPTDNLPAIFCTNHYVARANNREPGSSSARRYDTMVQMVRDALAHNRPIDVPAAEQILSAVAAKDFTLLTQMSVVALPASRTLHVAISQKLGTPATNGPWIQVAWSDLFNAK